MASAGRVRALIALSRPPFVLVGLAPFLSGVALAAMRGYRVDPGLLALSLVGLTAILLATYYSNEYFDYEGDLLNVRHNRFSGGTRVFPSGLLPRQVGLYALAGSLAALAAATAVYVPLYMSARPLLPLMALAGAVMGVLYSGPPGRWAYRGLGEVMIAVAYGWLAVSSGYYAASGRLSWAATVLSIPASLTVFSLILVNELPDYEADVRVSKRNLVVRLGGPARARYLYSASMAASAVAEAWASLALGGPLAAAVTALVFTPPALYAALRVTDDRVIEDTRGAMERLSALTVALDLVAPYLVLLTALLPR